MLARWISDPAPASDTNDGTAQASSRHRRRRCTVSNTREDVWVSETLSRFVKRGIRVLVPFQGRQLVGYVTELNPIQPAGIKLKAIKDVVDAERPTFDESMVDFLLWLSRYYQAPIGEVFRGAHPSGTNAKSVAAVQLVESDVPVLPGMYPEKLSLLIKALRANDGIARHRTTKSSPYRTQEMDG